MPATHRYNSNDEIEDTAASVNGESSDYDANAASVAAPALVAYSNLQEI